MAAPAVLNEKESGIRNTEFGSGVDQVSRIEHSASSICYLTQHLQRDQRQELEEQERPVSTFFARAYRYIQSIGRHAPGFGSKFHVESVTEDSNWADRKNKKHKTAKKRIKNLKKMW